MRERAAQQLPGGRPQCIRTTIATRRNTNGCGSKTTSRCSASPTSRRRSWARSSSWSCRRSGTSTTPATRSARSSRSRRSPRSSPRSPARSSRSTRRWPTTPSSINEDPHVDGWLVKIRYSASSDLDSLMDAESLRRVRAAGEALSCSSRSTLLSAAISDRTTRRSARCSRLSAWTRSMRSSRRPFRRRSAPPGRWRSMPPARTGRPASRRCSTGCSRSRRATGARAPIWDSGTTPRACPA